MGKKNWWLTIGLVVVLVIVGLAGCSPDITALEEIESLNISSQQEGIWVSGTGVITVIPNIAILRLGVAVQGTSVAVAQSQAAEAMEEIMAVLTGNGVTGKDIQTQYFSIHQITKWDSGMEQEILVGYRVNNMITAKIREIDKVGIIIDAVATAGEDLTQIDSIDFSVDNPSAYYEEAREKAMIDAKVKAEQLAELADGRLGKVTYISESAQIPPPIYRQNIYDEAMSAATTTISPGEIEVSLTVQIAYALLY